ncbi:glycoside hydrolase family 31 protein [Anaerosporobacter faecicola]|uniref:glycoside hydrolase family 31 protein n=1 Tax=Anaerosporobacter faecicola TaxID=2718714 RepID=UPI00143C8429|nr:TIM-barrel domain-containing protein [Anaerosporobacter faecicola]
MMRQQVEIRKQQVIGDSYRITMLTPRLLRLEYQSESRFRDEPTQIVLNREFPSCEFRCIETEEQLEIITECIHVTYDKKMFSNQGLKIQVRGNLTIYHSTWNYGDPIQDLKGTARTLDLSDGEVPLDQGILSWNGFTVLDDSRSFNVTEEGTITSPMDEYKDLYFFGYGRAYLDALRDYYKLTGNTPLLPRYALGNWWSRFYQYTQESYMELIQTFQKKEVPLAIAVIDMDWHLVNIDPKYGSGWTGYTWNDALFPDHKAFLQWLHEQNLHVTLNEHPAEGIRGHEVMYKEMAQALGRDTSHEDPIAFDITDPEFVKAYFTYIHHRYEEEGVDFWWLDWQQGCNSKIPGLDPLWLLNYYHFKDNSRNKKRGMILSRYAGPGSHRYPIGFSGDTVMSWKSLAFQPYFTANASNIGYSWWSHDIGGHMLGIRCEELAVRWLQFGVFSPIMRLHSSSSPFNRKEPWSYQKMTEEIMISYMQLRHRLLPYLYTMNERCHSQGEPLIQPMYYQHAECEQAYYVPNQYYFGSQLIVHPITTRADTTTLLGSSMVWLPEGLFIDVMTGMLYRGGRSIQMYRPIHQLPVLAKAGAIVPMAVLEGKDTISNPKKMDLYIYAGEDGLFTLYEDDGETYEYEQGAYAKTTIVFCAKKGTIEIKPVEGDTSCIPKEREYRLHLVGFAGITSISSRSNDTEQITYHKERGEYETGFYQVTATQGAVFQIQGTVQVGDNSIKERIFQLLDRAEMETLTKERIYDEIKKDQSPYVLTNLMKLDLEKDLFQAISEIVLAY